MSPPNRVNRIRVAKNAATIRASNASLTAKDQAAHRKITASKTVADSRRGNACRVAINNRRITVSKVEASNRKGGATSRGIARAAIVVTDAARHPVVAVVVAAKGSSQARRRTRQIFSRKKAQDDQGQWPLCACACLRQSDDLKRPA
jgi:hypothetical protein